MGGLSRNGNIDLLIDLLLLEEHINYEIVECIDVVKVWNMLREVLLDWFIEIMNETYHASR